MKQKNQQRVSVVPGAFLKKISCFNYDCIPSHARFSFKTERFWLLGVAPFRLLAVSSYFYIFSLSPRFPFTDNCGELSQRYRSVRHGLLMFKRSSRIR